MNRVLVAVALFATLSLSGQTLLPISTKIDKVSDQHRQAVLLKAVSVQILEDGSEWITHPVVARQEASPIGVTRFSKDDDARLFLASDWLPKGTVPRGSVGQIYSVALLTAGRLAASVGWNDGASHNAIVILKAGRDGALTSERFVEVHGIGQIVSGPQDTILALTDDVTARGGGAALTLYGADGSVLGEFFHRDQSVTASQAVQATLRGRLQEVGGSRYAMFDPLRQRVHVFDLSLASPGRAARLTMRNEIFIDVDPQASQSPVAEIAVSPSGITMVVRTGVFDGRPCTMVTRFDGKGRLLGSWKSQNPWRVVARGADGFTGTALKDALVAEHVQFQKVD